MLVRRLAPAAFASSLAVLSLTPSARAEQAQPLKTYPAVQLLSTGTTVLGEPLAYPGGAPHVNASLITLTPGQRTMMHKHGVPMFAYILEGEITVDYGARGRRTYKAGEALMEAMDVSHAGENTGTQVMRLIAVYMGAAGAKDVIPTP